MVRMEEDGVERVQLILGTHPSAPLALTVSVYLTICPQTQLVFERLSIHSHLAAVNENNLQAYSVDGPTIAGNGSWITAQRMLLGVWLVMGVLPLTLQLRSYLQFVTPHKMSEVLVVPPDLQRETANLTEHCPVTAFVLAGVWWNFETTHYYKADQGIVCHAVVPQYNLHGNYFIGNIKTKAYQTTPSSCANDSFPFEQYLYHGSIGYYSYYEGEVGTYCAKDNTAYIVVEVLGTYDINGVFLADGTGTTESRMSWWYSIVGAIWLVYRALMIRRSYVSCRRYGRRCDELGEKLDHQEAMVFVQESMRLSAHGARNYQRAALLYLIVEGIMTDLFLIIANDGWATRVQYASMGYNLSGLMLLLFEMVESMRWFSDKWRLRVKRVFLSYETALVGEFVSALAFQTFLSGLNGSDLKRLKPTALAVSYYFWSLICHGIVVVVVVLIILSVRVPWALLYVWFKHHSFAVLSEPCCIDTTLGVRSRIMLLGGYRWEDGKLFYKTAALKAFGLLKMEEDGAEYLVLHKLYWLTVPRDNLIGVGIITGHRVEPCNERPCTADQGIVCHAVVPQYNLHGNYFIGNIKTKAYQTTPSSCANDSFPFEQYLYHGSIGYYSYYEGEVGTYCIQDNTAYIVVDVMGTFDINGSFLAKDTGSYKLRLSYWYSIVGVVWLVYRALVIRRSYALCRQYGRRCDELGEKLQQQQAMVFVQESLRLSAHGATNYQRTALLYLIVEGIMTDLFLIIASDGWTTRVKYASMGYNLSGLMLLLFEMLESTRFLKEMWRLRIKRTFFNYETALVGELISALAFQRFLSSLNGSDLKQSKQTAIAMSYYLWSLICHGIVVLVVILIISCVRALVALMYVWFKHHSLLVLSEPCCIDTALGVRSRVMLLGGYQLEDGILSYKPPTLKALGMLKWRRRESNIW
ncbi:unnamed protein product [Phytophthora lilii]|uniref:Unnamed protein product n=1 Tax=Phytophthora lilii TaxID=2077276 RepID=A0A9W6TIE1_9STRA|nr:unnamed protein product [Phytophthora lilii]